MLLLQTPIIDPEVLKYGVLGLMFCFVAGSFYLLRTEQKREGTIRKSMLTAIYVFMGFAILLSPVAILAEYFKKAPVDIQEEDVNAIIERIQEQSAGLSLFNSTGEILDDGKTFNVKGNQYTLFEPAEDFDGFSRELENYDVDDISKVKVYTKDTFMLGYLDKGKLKEDLGIIASPIPTDNEHQGWKLQKVNGLNPQSFELPGVYVSMSKKELANYLFQVIESESYEKPDKRKAIKGLANLFDYLSLDEYKKLINILKGGIREKPYRFWELAQTYSAYYDNYPGEVDKAKNTENQSTAYKDYISYYDDPANKKIVTAQDNSARLKEWYEWAKSETGVN